MREINLGDLCKFRGGSAFPQDEQGAANGHVPFVKVSDLALPSNGKYIQVANNWISKEQVERLKPVLAPPASILFAKIGAGLHSERFRIASRDTAFDNNMMSATARPSLCDPNFLYYLLHTLGISKVAVGSALPYLKQSDLASLPCRVPEMGQQRSIAEVLGALDDKIAANTRVASTAHELADLLYSRAVKSLPKVRMSEHLESVLGGTPKRSEDRYWNGGIPWASAKDVASADFGVVLDTSEFITAEAAHETKVKPLPVGSVILTARGTVGAVARLGMPTAINQSCYGFVPGALPKSVLYFAVRSTAAQARSLAHGSVFDTITRRTFDFVDVPDGESAEMATLEGELAGLLEVSESRIRENAALAKTRDSLLPLLTSGRVTVKDAERVVEEAV